MPVVKQGYLETPRSQIALLALGGLIALQGWYYADLLRFGCILVTAVLLMREITASSDVLKYEFASLPALPVWLMFSLASVIWSGNPGYTVEYWIENQLTGLFLFVLGYVALYKRQDGEGLVAAAGVLWLFGLWGGVLSFGHRPELTELFEPGLWGWQSYFAGTVVLLFPVLLVSMIYLLKRFGVVPAFAVYCLYMLIAYFTVMRGLLLTLLVVLLIFVTLAGWFAKSDEVKRWWPWSLLVLLVAFALFVLVSLQKPPSWAHPNAQPEILGAFVKNERYGVWHFWLGKVPEHLWLGLGYGLYLPTVTYAHSAPPWIGADSLTHAHNVFLDIALQLGVVGVLLFGWLLWQLLMRFYRQQKTAGNLWNLIGMMLVLGPVLKNLTDETWFGENAQLWMLLLGGWLGSSRAHSDKNCHS